MPVASSPLGVDLDYSDKLRTQWDFQSSPNVLNTAWIFLLCRAEIEDFFVCLFCLVTMSVARRKRFLTLKLKREGEIITVIMLKISLFLLQENLHIY